jgi:hypothetical protein
VLLLQRAIGPSKLQASLVNPQIILFHSRPANDRTRMITDWHGSVNRYRSCPGAVVGGAVVIVDDVVDDDDVVNDDGIAADDDLEGGQRRSQPHRQSFH